MTIFTHVLAFTAGGCLYAAVIGFMLWTRRPQPRIERRWAVLDSDNRPIELTDEQYQALAGPAGRICHYRKVS